MLKVLLSLLPQERCIVLVAFFCVAGFGVEETKSYYEPHADTSKVRSEWWAALSFVAPGFAQYRDQNLIWGLGYSGTAISGAGLALANISRVEQGSREVSLGLQLYQTAGSISAFHGFRTAAEVKKLDGKYLFLDKAYEDTPTDVLTASLRMDYLLRPTTFIPLGLMAGLLFYVLPKVDSSVHFEGKNISLGDVGFLSGTSIMAGTGEEALFRGYLMPWARQGLKSDIWSNLLTSTVFALAHVNLSDKSKLFVPWPQMVGGLYFGWLTQYRNWSITESIFVHTWYDILVFSAAAATGELKTGGYRPLFSFGVPF